jgi:indole-3-glycerol phosphate synthase
MQIAKALGMNALVEVHTLEELDRVLNLSNVALIGINNRNLETFDTTLSITQELITARKAQLQERNLLIVSESGIHDYDHVEAVRAAGAQAILVGESLMKQPDPGLAIDQLFQGRA